MLKLSPSNIEKYLGAAETVLNEAYPDPLTGPGIYEISYRLSSLTPAAKIPWGFGLSPDGRFVMVAASEGATLKAYQISESGALKEVGSLAWDKNIMSIVTR